MSEQVLKRVCELEVGDCFLYYGAFHWVGKITDRIYIYGYKAITYRKKAPESFGKNCRMKVEIVNVDKHDAVG